jgi:SNF2 family DNA or RNA helicase
MKILHPYQNEGITFLQRIQRGLLADEPGLGKSAQALRAAWGRTLIVAPRVMIESGDWGYEHELWRPNLDVTFCSYATLPDRVVSTKGASKGRRVITIPRLRPEYQEKWDTIILDEAHRIRGRQADTTQAVWRLKSDRLIMLTGSPIPNWAIEFYSLLRMIFPEDRRFSSFWRWADRWFRIWTAPWGSREILGLKSRLSGSRCECEFNKKLLTRVCNFCWATFYSGNDLDNRMLRRTWEDVGIELPPMTVKTIELSMGKDQRVVYDGLKKDYRVWVEEAGEHVNAWSSGGLHTKLMKLTTGVGVELPAVGLRQSNKLAAFQELASDFVGNSLVVFCLFRQTVRLAAEAAKKSGHTVGVIMGGIKDVGLVKRSFQEGTITCLVGTLDSMSESLQLTKGHIAIFIERSWRPSTNTQALRRIWRMGQEHACLVIFLITKGSLDQRQTIVLEQKDDQQIRALTAGQFLHLLEDEG